MAPPRLPSCEQDPYYLSRQGLLYYGKAAEYLQDLRPRGRTLVDVGSRSAPVWLFAPAGQAEGYELKVAIDKDPIPTYPDATSIRADFLTAAFDRRFDLVCCLQTLEHQASPRWFVRKLFALAGHGVVLSVPYKWPHGFYPPHVQDPVDEAKLRSWTGMDPHKQELVVEANGLTRLVAAYKRRPHQGWHRHRSPMDAEGLDPQVAQTTIALEKLSHDE